MVSNLPSSVSNYSPSHGATKEERKEGKKAPTQDFSPAVLISVVALVISLASFYVAYFTDKPLSPGQKAALKEIADEIRSLQGKEIMLGAPVETRLYLNQSYPAKDMFPETFNISMDFYLPVDTQIVAVSSTGMPVSFRVQDNIPIKANIPISNKAFGNSTIRISKEFPVEARFSSMVKVRAAYGKELNNIIDKLEALASDNS